MSTPIGSRLVGVCLAVTALLTLIVALMSVQVSHMREEVVVMRAQVAAAPNIADIMVLDRDFHHLDSRIQTVERWDTSTEIRLRLVEARTDQVTTDDMQEFSTNLTMLLDEVYKRIRVLEMDDPKHIWHGHQ